MTKKSADRWTDGPTDGPTDRRMDIPSYRVAWMRLKKDEMVVQFHYMKKVGKDIIFTFVFYVVHHNDKKDCIQGV